MTKALIILTGSLLSLATMAQKPSIEFNVLDANKDGLISKGEAQAEAKLSADFDKLDLNKDGLLSKAELAAFNDLEKTIKN
ncbi:hypothetical protein [Paraglaciecola sp.]|uniref:hypothetical protein n=1 Tax=Paraglaciecola sp. TaxID=1920173 RepID=UPI003EF45E5C